MENDDVVFIGNKPVMNYVLAMVTSDRGKSNVSAMEITIGK